MIYANVTSERIPVVLSPIRADVYPHDDTIDPSGATRLVALSVLDDRIYLSLDEVADRETLDAMSEEERQAFNGTARWWRTVRVDSPGEFSWTYGPAPISNAPSLLDGDDRMRLCEAHHADLAQLDYLLTRIAQERWPSGWGELPLPLPPYPTAMLSHTMPLFPQIVQAGAFDVDAKTGVATPVETT